MNNPFETKTEYIKWADSAETAISQLILHYIEDTRKQNMCPLCYLDVFFKKAHSPNEKCIYCPHFVLLNANCFNTFNKQYKKARNRHSLHFRKNRVINLNKLLILLRESKENYV